ncbi:MAG: ABC transporter ATP-binding protein [Candidatus Methanofastidiosia archaeon]|jgi:putative ABC transport system ATP-binding protein
MSEIVELQNVTKHYLLGKITVRALRGITVKVTRGDFIAVVGPSGSGKTTLLNLMGCLDKPTSGILLFEGDDISALSSNRLADIRSASVGFVFQHFNLIPVLTAFENVEFPLLLKKLDKTERKKRVTTVLEKVGLKDKMGRTPFELSGGEQQRVAIARALAGGPDIVLADEPTGDLDSAMGEKVIGLMKDLNAEGTTFVFSTHDPAIMKHATRIVKLHDGKIVSG